MKKIFIALVVVLTFTLVACEPVETGSIDIISPSIWPTIIRDDPFTSFFVVLSSSYQNAKTLEIQNNDTATVTCYILGKEQNKNCSVPISIPGDQNITIKVPLNNGTQITLHTTFKWLPYSQLDKQMLFGLFNFPIWGYLTVYLFTIITVFLVTVLLTKKNYETSSTFATIFSAALIVYTYFLPSLEQAVKAGYYIYPVFFYFLIFAVKYRYFYKPTLVIYEEGGNELRYTTKPPHNLANRHLRIKASDINNDLYLKPNEEK